MDYESILKIVMNLKDRKNNDSTCYICHFPIKKKDDQIKLKCKHNYHTECLFDKKKKFIKCPYCLTITKFPEKKIKKEITNKCLVIIKHGKNKGNICGRNNCKIHKNKKCQVILKSGKRKGEKCNRIDCKYHKHEKNKKNIIV